MYRKQINVIWNAITGRQRDKKVISDQGGMMVYITNGVESTAYYMEK